VRRRHGENHQRNDKTGDPHRLTSHGRIEA
jgi:hypothetical protein